MSDDGSVNNYSDLKVYVFRGKEGEEVPKSVEELIVEQGVQEVPGELCFRGHDRLREVTLPNHGLIKIGAYAFATCHNLLEITIGSTVQFIGYKAFEECVSLKKLEFESSASSTHQLQTIDNEAFEFCKSLQRIKLPSSVNTVRRFAFYCCGLIQVDLSTTCLIELTESSFRRCLSLQTVSLPKSLQKIGNLAFFECVELVAVLVPLGSKPIELSYRSFDFCYMLTNLELPKDSKFDGTVNFGGCTILQRAHGKKCSRIVDGLIARFEGFPIHRMCYHHSQTTVQDLQQCFAELGSVGRKILVDNFGMTPFHILFSTIDPSLELLNVLLNSLPNRLLTLQDANGKRPLDYLVNNWTNGAFILAQTTLEKSMIDVVGRWGATIWMDDMRTKIQPLLVADERRQRASMCDEVYSAFEQYTNLEATSILEMALWKSKLKSGSLDDGSKRQALDREACRCRCGVDIVIPRIAILLGITP